MKPILFFILFLNIHIYLYIYIYIYIYIMWINITSIVHWNLWYHLHIHFHGLKSTSKGICNFNYKRRVLLVLFLKYCFVFSTFHSFASACMMHTKTHSLTILVPIFIRGQLILLPSWFHSSMIIFPYHHCNY